MNAYCSYKDAVNQVMFDKHYPFYICWHFSIRQQNYHIRMHKMPLSLKWNVVHGVWWIVHAECVNIQFVIVIRFSIQSIWWRDYECVCLCYAPGVNKRQTKKNIPKTRWDRESHSDACMLNTMQRVSSPLHLFRIVFFD